MIGYIQNPGAFAILIRLINRAVTSLAEKLVLSIGLLMMLSVGILLYRLTTSEKNNLTNNAIRQTASYSDIIKKSIHYNMLTFHREAIQHTVESIGSSADIKKITIFDKKGKIFYSSDVREIGRLVGRTSNACLGCHADPLKPSETLRPGKQWTIYEGKEGHRKLTYTDPIYNGPSCYTAACHFHPEEQKILGILQTDFSLLSVDNDIRKQTLNITLSALVFMCVTSMVLFLFLRNFVHKPVSLLSKAMQQIAGDNTSRRVDINSSDEIGMLAAAFNAMSENLQKTTVSRDLLVKEVKEHKEVQEQLVKSERFLNTVFESIQEPFIILDRDYRIVRVNKAYARLRNIPLLDLLDEKCHKILHGKDGICDNCIVEKTFRSSDPCAMDRMIQLEDGTEAWFDIYTYPITDEQGQVSHVIEYLQDITHRKRAEKATKNAYIELEQIFNTAADGMCVIDKNFKILRVNKTFLSMFGRSSENLAGRFCYDIFPDAHCGTPDCPLTKIMGGEPMVQFETEKKGIDGTTLHFILTATAFRGPDGELLGIVEDFKDISERKRMEEELRSLSLRDELTGLYNRRGFIALAERELKIADRLKRGIFLLYADLDGLKVINDTLGHKEGDMAIRETAVVLSETFRNSDIIGRIGGDEFVIVPIGIAGDNIDVITARLQKNVDIQNGKIDRNYKLSLSVGLAYYDPEHPETIDGLLIRADALMYEQKKNKRKS
jgi:diguanylate cyclase (GGDEF)-like protein/PAS domain S-box-containing protein